MKRICTLLLAAGMLLGAATGASAIDFKAKGQWLFGFGVGENNFINNIRNTNGVKSKANSEDTFAARQRIRLQLDAVASESLSGSVQFELGQNRWGQADSGGALGADSNNVIKLRQAYLDWAMPQSDLKVRMGLQYIIMPNKAGGSAVLDTPIAGIVASYKVNDNASITGMWMRPFNDNFVGNVGKSDKGFLDNMDLFALTLPIKLDGFEITPWGMFGAAGLNTMSGYNTAGGWSTSDGNPSYTMMPSPDLRQSDFIGQRAYGTMFWAGLPFAITAWDPINIEVDLNYGYVESMGTYTASRADGFSRRSSTKREGWLAKALVEYKMDWGTPGLFGWYGSGDNGNPKEGSQRMPSVLPYGNFTSYMGDGNLGWGPGGSYFDKSVSYAGTWGIGLQLRDMSFLQDLKHTFRIAYWGGTNSTSMVKYMKSSSAWNGGTGNFDGPYLTTADSMLEFNLVNSYKIYENLEMNLELGYIANFMDNSTWKKADNGATSFEKKDAWKAQVVFAYTF